MKFKDQSSPIRIASVIASMILLSACGADNNSSSDTAQSTASFAEGKLVATVTQQAIDSAMIDNGLITLTGEAACDVELYEVSYPSIGVQGEAITLSGALSIPSGPDCQGPFPLLAKAHGTRTLTTHSESAIANSIIDHAFFAAHGYVVISPDYLGLGTSDYNYHPYLHSESEAQSMIDAIRAARTSIAKLDSEIELSGKVMLIGYSQGGHTVMATQREIETRYPEEFNLVASAPLAGPFKLEETFSQGINPDIENIAGGTLAAYAIQSYQNIYGNIYNNLSDVFLPLYTDIVNEKFPGDTGVIELILNGTFPTSVDQFLTSNFITDFNNDNQHSFRLALRDNEVLDSFIPTTPMMMCGSSADGTVPFFNTIEAEQYFQSIGITTPVIDVATMVQVPIGADAGLTHHLQGNPICYAQIKARLFDLSK